MSDETTRLEAKLLARLGILKLTDGDGATAGYVSVLEIAGVAPIVLAPGVGGGARVVLKGGGVVTVAADLETVCSAWVDALVGPKAKPYRSAVVG